MSLFVKEKAKTVRQQLNGRISYNTVKRYAEEEDFQVLSYKDNWDIIKDLKVEERARHSNSFIYIGEELRIIFIDKHTNEEQIFLLLHELGHYLLGHTSNQTNSHSIKEENDANLFAQYVLEEEKKPVNKPVIIALAIIVTVITFYNIYLGVYNPVEPVQTPPPPVQQEQQEAKPEESTGETEQQYVITRTGDKYHLPDCYYVKDKTDLITLSLEEALTSKYEPCKICIE